MKRIYVENEFTQWAEYLARYFGQEIKIYDKTGELMWGKPNDFRKTVAQLKRNPWVHTVHKDIGEVVAYLDASRLTPKETTILSTIIPFIESQLDDEGA